MVKTRASKRHAHERVPGNINESQGEELVDEADEVNKADGWESESSLSSINTDKIESLSDDQYFNPELSTPATPNEPPASPPVARLVVTFSIGPPSTVLVRRYRINRTERFVRRPSPKLRSGSGKGAVKVKPEAEGGRETTKAGQVRHHPITRAMAHRKAMDDATRQTKLEEAMDNLAATAIEAGVPDLLPSKRTGMGAGRSKDANKYGA